LEDKRDNGESQAGRKKREETERERQRKGKGIGEVARRKAREKEEEREEMQEEEEEGEEGVTLRRLLPRLIRPEFSSSEMLAPLQKRSAKRPGTVLKMLVDHSLVSTGGGRMTARVKLTSYFNLVIRPYHQSSSRDMKELHHLAVALDELRGGQLGQLGDSLAARFLATHMAVNEGHWRSVQFLEIHPLEPAA
jgi:hypothetical protein